MKYLCEKCKFSTNKQYNYNQHLLTKKHLSDNKIENVKCECNKEFKNRSGFWKHKQICIFQEKVEPIKPENEIMMATMNKLINSQKNMENLIMELIKTKDIPHQLITNNTDYSTYHNNINVFLNENCKNAINIMDFINAIVIDMKDANMFKEKGYIEAMTEIIVKSLKKHSIQERPFHYIDNGLNRDNEIHIKHENIWNMECKYTPIFDRTIYDIDEIIYSRVDKITNNPQIQKSLADGLRYDVKDKLRTNVLEKIVTNRGELVSFPQNKTISI
jgi:hypothetical protein